ncbi:MAG: hypothetical protein GC185_13795 [Alphaproteobacteria bacterium]|nr:hypothetical protein [Alphaproteobacteria bacterium]
MNFQYDSYAYFFDLLAFAPVLLLLYFSTSSPRLRRLAMTASGMYLMSFIAPRLVLFYLVFWLLVFFVHRCAFTEEGGRRPWLRGARRFLARFSIVLFALPLLLWKIYGNGFTLIFTAQGNELLSLFSTKLWELDMARSVVIPLGLSFTTFRALDLVIKTYLGKIENLRLDEVLFYGFFPPVQVFGPIIEYEDVARQDHNPDAALFLYGLLRVTGGFLKVFVAAAFMHPHVAFPAAPAALPVWVLWLKLLGYYLYLYLNFSGYSDVAVGASALFGFRIKENFNFPLWQTNIQDYWNSWHMSLTHWARRNVYVPAGGYRAETQYLAIFCTMMVIALWHKLTPACFIYGLYHGGLMAGYRHLSEARDGAAEGKTPLWRRPAAGRALTYLAVSVSLPLIFIPESQLLPYYAALLGMGR